MHPKYRVPIFVNNHWADSVNVGSNDELRSKLPKLTRKCCKKGRSVQTTLVKDRDEKDVSGDQRIIAIRYEYTKAANTGRRSLPVAVNRQLPWKDAGKVYCPVARL